MKAGFIDFPKRLLILKSRFLKGYEVIEMSEIKDHEIHITLSDGDFVESMGRMPENQDEFDRWAELAEKGLMNGHIDWDIIYECTKDAMSCD